MKKRINVYLTPQAIKQADEIARKISYELGVDVNRSNILEIAIKYLQQSDAVSVAKTILERDDDE